jgi:MFS family permease
MAVPQIIAGILALTLGRRLFWLFVGVVGFVVGITLAPQFLPAEPAWLTLVIAIAIGLLGALLAVFVQTVAIALAGFIGGGYIAMSLLSMAVGETGRLAWVAFVVGGILGVILVTALFDYALIILSSLVGAGLIVQAVDLRPLFAALLFVVLFVAGAGIQAGLWQRRERPKPPPPTQR